MATSTTEHSLKQTSLGAGNAASSLSIQHDDYGSNHAIMITIPLSAPISTQLTPDLASRWNSDTTEFISQVRGAPRIRSIRTVPMSICWSPARTFSERVAFALCSKLSLYYLQYRDQQIACAKDLHSGLRYVPTTCDQGHYHHQTYDRRRVISLFLDVLLSQSAP